MFKLNDHQKQLVEQNYNTIKDRIFYRLSLKPNFYNNNIFEICDICCGFMTEAAHYYNPSKTSLDFVNFCTDRCLKFINNYYRKWYKIKKTIKYQRIFKLKQEMGRYIGIRGYIDEITISEKGEELGLKQKYLKHLNEPTIKNTLSLTNNSQLTVYDTNQTQLEWEDTKLKMLKNIDAFFNGPKEDVYKQLVVKYLIPMGDNYNNMSLEDVAIELKMDYINVYTTLRSEKMQRFIKYSLN